ncbi:IclR family transcriptional regulator [Streptomyces sp. NPDC051243]|uniref:IclR family transcriptional regulator n=1 Tax=Streptomyces sp. NPDC051243 TaxID=3365646 RepID=UPI0037A42E65
MTTPHSAAPERSVVDRTLSILGVFDRANRTLTLSDISRRSGLPVATVHRIVSKLHSWGALERRPEGTYGIGLRLWETGCLATRPSALVEGAQPHLVELQARSSAMAVIAIRDGLESVSLSVVTSSPCDDARTVDPGCRLPLHATSLGLVLLAHAEESVRDAICAGPLRAYTPATITNGAALRRRLDKVRLDGYAIVHDALITGRGGIAAPVRDSRGAVVAAVAAVGAVAVIRPTTLVPHVRAAADAVSRCVRTAGAGVGEVGV